MHGWDREGIVCHNLPYECLCSCSQVETCSQHGEHSLYGGSTAAFESQCGNSGYPQHIACAIEHGRRVCILQLVTVKCFPYPQLCVFSHCGYRGGRRMPGRNSVVRCIWSDGRVSESQVSERECWLRSLPRTHCVRVPCSQTIRARIASSSSPPFRGCSWRESQTVTEAPSSRMSLRWRWVPW